MPSAAAPALASSQENPDIVPPSAPRLPLVPRFRLVVLEFLALLLSAGIFSVGVSLYRLLIPYGFAEKGINAGIIGTLVSAMAFGGMVAATVWRQLIVRVGHVRVFCANAALLIFSLVALQLIQNIFILIILLLILGFASSSGFLTIESWLHQQVRNVHRARLFGGYLMVYYTATIIGQYSINLKSILEAGIYLIPVLLLALSILPLALTNSATPQFVESPNVSFKSIWQKYRLSFVGIILGSSCLGPIIFTGPIIANSKGLDIYSMSIFLAATSLGAVSFQYPMGMINDKFDRFKVILTLNILIILLAIVLVLAPSPLIYLAPIMFCMGGCITCLYPAYVNLAFRQMSNNEIIGVSAKFLLLAGVGNTLGIAITGWLIDWLADAGFAAYLIVCSLVLAFMVTRAIRAGETIHEGAEVESAPIPLASSVPPIMNVKEAE